MWRNKYIAPRRNPLALAAYALIFLMGLLFIVGLFHSEVIDALLGTSFWRLVWEWLLAGGGAVGFLGAVWNRDLEDGMWMERLGATTSTLGLVTYAGGITWAVGFQAPTWLLLGVLALGCLVRSFQLTKEMQRVRHIAEHYLNGDGS
jgi:uncharacterized membrane protein YciS (DUF1049 family)